MEYRQPLGAKNGRETWEPLCYNTDLNSAHNLNELVWGSICRVPRGKHVEFGLLKPRAATLHL